MGEYKPIPHSETCHELYLATNTDYDTAVKALSTPLTVEEWQAMVWWIDRHAPQHEKQAIQNGWTKDGWKMWNFYRAKIIATTTNVYPSAFSDNSRAQEAKFFWAYLVLPTYKRFRPFLPEYNTGAMNIAAKYDLYINAMVEMLAYKVQFLAEYIERDRWERIEEERQQRTNSTEANK